MVNHATNRHSDGEIKLIDEDGVKSEVELSVAEVKRKCSKDEYDEIFDFFSNLSGEYRYNAPNFVSMWGHIMFEEQGALIESVLIYRKIDDILEQQSYDRIELYNTRGNIVQVAQDLAGKYNLRVSQHNCENSIVSILSSFNILTIFLLMVEQIVFSIYNGVFGISESLPPIFFPYPGRENNMAPVIKETSFDSIVVSYSLYLLRFVPGYNTPSSDETVDEWTYITEFSTFTAIYNELDAIYSAVRPQKHLIVNQLGSDISDEFEIEMENSIEYAYQTAISGNLRSICYGALVDEFLSEANCNCVTIGGFHPRERAIAMAASNQSASVYYIPHSLEKEYESPPPTELTIFTSGPKGSQQFNDLTNDRFDISLISSGGPYIADMMGKYKMHSNHCRSDGMNILLATQNKPDYTRESFFIECLYGIRNISVSTSPEIIVKTHPSEDSSFYRELIASHEFPGTLSIEESNLHEHILNADLLLTINSNVALEAMLLGTPCIIINYFEPFEANYPFTQDNSVPVARDRQELVEIFQELTSESIAELQQEQVEFSRNAYLTSSDIPVTIAENLKKRCVCTQR